jgi:hypothetical protein
MSCDVCTLAYMQDWDFMNPQGAAYNDSCTVILQPAATMEILVKTDTLHCDYIHCCYYSAPCIYT